MTELPRGPRFTIIKLLLLDIPPARPHRTHRRRRGVTQADDDAVRPPRRTGTRRLCPISAARRVVGAPWRAALTIGSRIAFERGQLATAPHASLQDFGLAASGRVDYVPSGWLSLRRMMHGLTPTNVDVFLDLGSGMGRIVNMAARRYPFKRVIGVEISGELNDIAIENARRLGGRFAVMTFSSSRPTRQHMTFRTM